MPERVSKYDELRGKVLKAIEPLTNTKDPVIATMKPAPVLELIREIAVNAKVEANGLRTPTKAFASTAMLREVSNYFHQASTFAPNIALTGAALEKFVNDYAFYCDAWGFEPKVIHSTYLGKDCVFVQTPEIRIPMPPIYPRGYMSCGSIQLLINMSGTQWGIVKHGAGPIKKEFTHSDRRLHPHDQGTVFCLGGWNDRLNKFSANGDFGGFIDCLMAMLHMDSSDRRFIDGYGGKFEYSWWGTCQYCGQTQTDLDAKRGGLAPLACRSCYGNAGVCNTCAKLLSGPADYAPKPCVKCTAHLWDPEKLPVNDIWWWKYPPPEEIPPCMACGTVAATRPRRPVTCEGINDWVCTHCKISDKPLKLCFYNDIKAR